MLFYVPLSRLLGPLAAVLDGSWASLGNLLALGDFWESSWGLLGPPGATWKPLGTHKSPLSLPEPPQGSQETSREAPKPAPEPPQSIPTASQMRRRALPIQFRQRYPAANWPRRDARSVNTSTVYLYQLSFQIYPLTLKSFLCNIYLPVCF